MIHTAYRVKFRSVRAIGLDMKSYPFCCQFRGKGRTGQFPYGSRFDKWIRFKSCSLHLSRRRRHHPSLRTLTATPRHHLLLNADGNANPGPSFPSRPTATPPLRNLFPFCRHLSLQRRRRRRPGPFPPPPLPPSTKCEVFNFEFLFI